MLFSFSPHGPPAWSGLHYARPPARQLMLSGWDDLTPPEKKRAMQNYELYEKLSPKERNTIDQLYERWRKLPPSERQRFREEHDRHRGGGRKHR